MKHQSHLHRYWVVPSLCCPNWSKLSCTKLFRGSKLPGLGKPWTGTRPPNRFQPPILAFFWELDTLSGPVLPLFWELDSLTGQTGKQNGSSLQVIAMTAFPKPQALVIGIPSGSLSQGQVTRQVYTKTLASLAMSPSEITSFPELFCVSGA